MENLFGFEYVELGLKNQDGSASNFRQVFGQNGVNVICPKGSYHIVKTADVNALAQVFVEKGYKVSTFIHRNGETIGLKIDFGAKMTKVGDCQYSLLITIPNNGTGRGYLTIYQVRLICDNGAVSSKMLHQHNYIKIPHTVDYNYSLKLMQESIEGFASLLEQVEQRDADLDAKVLTDAEVRFELNKWFFEYELPKSQMEYVDENNKVQKLTFDKFRELIALNPDSLKCSARYDELIEAWKREQEYNKTLDLKTSMYTVYASVTNYLSRRVEKSNSTASHEVQVERASEKLAYFDKV